MYVCLLQRITMAHICITLAFVAVLLMSQEVSAKREFTFMIIYCWFSLSWDDKSFQIIHLNTFVHLHVNVRYGCVQMTYHETLVTAASARHRVLRIASDSVYELTARYRSLQVLTRTGLASHCQSPKSANFKPLELCVDSVNDRKLTFKESI